MLSYQQKYSIATMLATNSRAATIDRLSAFGMHGGNIILFIDVIDRAIGSKRDGHLSKAVLHLVRSLEVHAEVI